MITTYPIAPHDQTEWDLCVRVSQTAPNTGVTPVRSGTVLAIDQALRDALAAPAQQTTDWREAVLDALASTGGDMPATATPAEIVRAVIDAHVQIALDPRVSDAAPAQQPEHPPLPVPRKPDENGAGWFTAGQMRAYIDADRAQRFTAPSVSDRNLDV